MNPHFFQFISWNNIVIVMPHGNSKSDTMIFQMISDVDMLCNASSPGNATKKESAPCGKASHANQT